VGSVMNDTIAKAADLKARLDRLEKRNNSVPATVQSEQFEPLAKVLATLAHSRGRPGAA
jgi:hypothetical protein